MIWDVKLSFWCWWSGKFISLQTINVFSVSATPLGLAFKLTVWVITGKNGQVVSPTTVKISMYVNMGSDLRLQKTGLIMKLPSSWLGGVVVSMSDSWSRGPGVRLPATVATALSVNNSGQVVNTHVPLSPSSTIWYWPKGGDALRKETVGLASHWPCGTDFSGFSTYRLTAKVREMSTPPTPIDTWSALPFFTIVKIAVQNVITKAAYMYMCYSYESFEYGTCSFSRNSIIIYLLKEVLLHNRTMITCDH